MHVLFMTTVKNNTWLRTSVALYKYEDISKGLLMSLLLTCTFRSIHRLYKYVLKNVSVWPALKYKIDLFGKENLRLLLILTS